MACGRSCKRYQIGGIGLFVGLFALASLVFAQTSVHRNGFETKTAWNKGAADNAYQNAKANTPHTARMAHDQALSKVMQTLLKEDTQVYKQFVENDSFKRFVSDMVYELTSAP